MALVVLLRGINVGGHRVMKPARLARQLRHLGAVNVGAAGTLVISARVTRAQLRAALARRIPFETEIVICERREIRRLVSRNHFGGHRGRPELVRFVSALSRVPPARSLPALPLALPPAGRWMVKVLARDGRFLVGLYRRQMRVIKYLDALDEVFGAPVTTRSWTTITAVARALDGAQPDVRGRRARR